MGDFFMETDDLLRRIGTADAPRLFDVRRREAFEADTQVIPTACWRDHRRTADWADTLRNDEAVVLYCAHGEQVSQAAAAVLRARGKTAFALRGGIAAWRAIGGPRIRKAGWPQRDETHPGRWVTRTRPKVDRIACPWFLRRFVDRDAEILFVAADQVVAVANEVTATPFDVEDVPFGHRGERCSFDAFLDAFEVDDAALRRLAVIVRGADTGRPDLAPEAAGLHALSQGLSRAVADDRQALEAGFPIYDALYAWCRGPAADRQSSPAEAATA